MKIAFNRKVLASSVLVLGLSSTAVYADNHWEGQARDAWIDGKLESSYLFNTELNNFKIDTSVEDGVVTLRGQVASDAHKMLAEQIASNLAGVSTVHNELTIEDEVTLPSEEDREFTSRVSDLTTTVSLKAQYAVNSEIEATNLDIDTKDGVVTLNGSVKSEAAKQLAEEIAAGKDSVKSVKNNLIVVRS